MTAGLWYAIHVSPMLADMPSAAPPLPAPTGTVVRVSTVAQLQGIMPKLTSDMTVVVEKGTYKLTQFLRIRDGLKNVTIRGATGNPTDVQIVGNLLTGREGNVPHGFEIDGAENTTIADLTIRDIHQHPITLNHGCGKVRIYHCHLMNAGTQFIKGNRYLGVGVPNGTVEYCTMEYPDRARTDYTNGVDVHGGKNWIIRHNLFKRIRGPVGTLAGHSVLMWNNSQDTIVEGNTFIDCDRGIALGLGDRSTREGKFDHVGGIVRNNVFFRTSTQRGDVGIYIADCPNAQVYHNTVLMNGTYANAIEYRFLTTTNCIIKHNLTDAPILSRAGATGTVSANLTTARTGWFVNAAAGNFRLQATATSAIDQLPVLTIVPQDFFGKNRPLGLRADFGAVEYQPAL